MSSKFIHIGYHKSASTFLQKNIFPKIDVNYFFLSDKSRDILDNVESANYNENLFKEQLKKINRPNAKEKADKILLSHEELSGFPDGHDNSVPFIVADNLKKTYPNAKVIIIIRQQFNYILSYYTFRVALKGHEKRKFSLFLDEAEHNGLFKKLEYQKLIEYYISNFGRKNVLVLPMEIIKTDTDKFVKTITDFIGVEKPEILNKKAINVSTKLVPVIKFWLPINFIFGNFIRLLHYVFKPTRKNPYVKFRFSFYIFKRKLTKLLNKIFSSAKKIDIKQHPSYAKQFKIYATNNRLIQKYTDFDLKEFDYPY